MSLGHAFQEGKASYLLEVEAADIAGSTSVLIVSQVLRIPIR